MCFVKSGEKYLKELILGRRNNVDNYSVKTVLNTITKERKISLKARIKRELSLCGVAEIIIFEFSVLLGVLDLLGDQTLNLVEIILRLLAFFVVVVVILCIFSSRKTTRIEALSYLEDYFEEGTNLNANLNLENKRRNKFCKIKVLPLDRTLWKNFLSFLGAIGGLGSIISVVLTIDDVKLKIGSSFNVLYLGALVLAYFVFFMLANLSKRATVKINNIDVVIKEGNILHQLLLEPSCREEINVIAVNEYYDTLVDDKIIAKDSLHGKYIKEIMGQGKLDNLISTIKNDDKLNKAKDNITTSDRELGNKTKYPLGSMVEFESYVLTAFTKFDSNNEAYLYAKDYLEFWMNFWDNIDSIYAGRTINIPLMGAGITRFKNCKPSKQVLLETILYSLKISGFSSSCSNFKINILIHEDDMKEIDFYSIQNNLKSMWKE